MRAHLDAARVVLSALRASGAGVSNHRCVVHAGAERRHDDTDAARGGKLGAPLTQLAVGGDATADRVLKFLKPSVTLDWKPGSGWHAQLSVRRTVAQLNFFDFVASANVSGGFANAGNANLVPPQSWDAELQATQNLGAWGTARLDPDQLRPACAPCSAIVVAAAWT